MDDGYKAEKVFAEELKYIKSDNIKKYVLECFDKLTPDYFYMDKKGNEVSEADAFAYFVIFHDEAGNPIKEAYGVISDKKEPSDEETPPEE